MGESSSDPRTVRVSHGDLSVDVSPEFAGIALGLLALDIGVEDVVRGGPCVFIVLRDSRDLESLSAFLVSNGLFPQEDGDVAVHGSLMMALEDLDGHRRLDSLYHVEVPEDQLSALESCLVSQVPAFGDVLS